MASAECPVKGKRLLALCTGDLSPVVRVEQFECPFCGLIWQDTSERPRMGVQGLSTITHGLDAQWLYLRA